MTTRRDVLKSGLSVVGMAAAASCGAPVKPLPKQALFWDSLGENVQCHLCPHQCTLAPGSTGIRRVRQNRNGTLVTNGYGNPCAVHIDPIEKKPFFHVVPGMRAYSIAVAGCNLRCLNCQNYTISQQSPLDTVNEDLPPQKVVEEAIKSNCQAIAYTYSEPTVWFEYMYDTAVLARKAGLTNVWVTSGYINPEPLAKLATVMDAATIDLKSFDNAIYAKLNAGTLAPVIDTIQHAIKKGVWVEVSTLVVPQWTDNLDMIRKMCAWHKDMLGPEVPLHFLRFFPLHMLAHLYPTPTDVMVAARKTALDVGLKYVYIGNVAEIDSNTYCPSCGKLLIKRDGYMLTEYDIVNGACKYCKRKIPGIWST